MSLSSATGLNNDTIQRILVLLKKWSKIQSIVLYGSRAKGNYRDGSDIDLTIVAPELTTSELLTIEGELDDLMLPYKIDISLFHQIENPKLVEHIERVGIVIFESKNKL